MTQRTPWTVQIVVVTAAALALAACGGSSGSGSGTKSTGAATATAVPPATATRTAVPSSTPSSTATLVPTATHTESASSAVSGQIVVDGQVRGDASDGLKPLPPDMMPPGSTGFDRGLGNADWVVDDGSASGTTDADGRFSIAGLTPGRHTVTVTKTVDGNLMRAELIIMVGDDGSAAVVAEVTWGLVRTTSTYTENGAAMRAVFAATGASLITRDGAVAVLSDGYRTLRDDDGDGRFDPQPTCEGGGQLVLCTDGQGCGPDLICACIGSCPFCEDCRVRACVPPSSTIPGPTDPACGPDGACKVPPYLCSEGDVCRQTGGSCQCIASCPDCDDCPFNACVPQAPCAATEIVSIDVYGPERLVIGQESAAGATAFFSDGSAMNVTGLATWASSDADVASVDGWGRIVTRAAGTTAITAALGDVESDPLSLTVVERPTLRRISLQNASCYYPYPVDDGTVRPVPPVIGDDVFAPPSCERVIRVGSTLQFIAVGEFDTGYYEDLTDEVAWRVEPAGVGSIAAGVFTGLAVGTARVSASLDGVDSDVIEVRVVDHATVVDLSIYPSGRTYMYPPVPIREGEPIPCADCGYFLLTTLRGDVVQFSATARYDTGEWEDVTKSVTWHSSDAAVATFDAGGALTAVGAGETSVSATLDDVSSASASVRVVNEATLQSVYAYQDGNEHVLGKGEQVVFHATGYYDIGFDRDVTAEAVWHSSDETVGGFDTPGVFTGRAAGTVMVWAEIGGQQSPPLALEVYATSELDFCDPDNVNRGVWSDDFNRVTLESDCAEYTPPDVVALRFSVTESQRPGGIFDPCLDLYAFRGDTLVRTIRQEGCGDPFLAPSAPDRDEAVLKYQLTAFWDLKDAAGETVPPGEYTIRGRFYLYYDPIVDLTIQVR